MFSVRPRVCPSAHRNPPSNAIPRIRLLDLADDLASLAQRLDHLLAFLSPTDGVIALLEQIVNTISPIHILQQLLLHVILGESVNVLERVRIFSELCTYATRFSMMALGTISIIVRLTML